MRNIFERLGGHKETSRIVGIIEIIRSRESELPITQILQAVVFVWGTRLDRLIFLKSLVLEEALRQKLLSHFDCSRPIHFVSEGFIKVGKILLNLFIPLKVRITSPHKIEPSSFLEEESISSRETGRHSPSLRRQSS
jgi:hypothetical protein